jgi:purine-binding chemotaxis protein CheW
MDGGSPDLSLICRVQTRLCALPLAYVVETMRPLPVQPWSGAPAFVRGLAIIRGSPIPVLDAAQLVEGDADGEGAWSERFVTVAVEHRRVALAVDDVLGVQSIQADALRELPPLLQNAAAVSAIGVLDARLLVVLHGARLMPYALHARLAADEPPA